MDNKQTLRANNGVTFWSICAKCNNEGLGPLDFELSIFAKHVSDYLKAKSLGLTFNNGYKISVPSKKIIQCIAGHILAAHDLPSQFADKLNHFNYPYLTILHKLYDGENLPRVTIGVWIHNYATVNIYPSAGITSFGAKQPTSLLSTISFFPLGFMIIERRYAPKEIPFFRLRTDTQKMNIDLTKLKIKSARYPYDSLGNEIIALNHNHVYTAEKLLKIF